MTTPPHSLTRRADLLCVQRGWEFVRTLASDDHELRRLVSQNSSHPAELVLRLPGALGTAETRAEMDALGQVSSENVIRLLDVVPLEPSRRRRGAEVPPPALLLEHPPGGTLEALLERRRSLRCGEAVTVLLAVADGIRVLHDSGWAHGSLSSRSIVMRRNGCAVVTGLASASPRTAETLAKDRAAFRAVAERVAVTLDQHDARRMLASLHAALSTSNWLVVASALLHVTEPEAVHLDGGDRQDERAVPAVASFATDPPASSSHGPSVFVDTLLDGNPLVELMGAAKTWMVRRKKVVLFATAPIAAAALALAVMPAKSVESVKPPKPVSSPGAIATPDRDRRADAPPDSGSEDPAVAAAALLDARHACFAVERPEQGCLDGVVEAGSALYRSDAAALGVPGAAEERDCRGVVLALDQRWGDAALVAVAPGEEQDASTTQPASLLMIRSEAGWLLREVYS